MNLGNAMTSKKRKSLPLEEKMKIIREAEDCPNDSKTDLATRLGVKYTTLCTILSKKEEIKQNFYQAGAKSSKRMRMQDGRFGDIEKCLLEWFDQNRVKDVPFVGA